MSDSGSGSLRRCGQANDWDSGELKVWLGLEDLLPRWHADMAVGKRPQFLTMWALQGAPEASGDMAAGFPQRK